MAARKTAPAKKTAAAKKTTTSKKKVTAEVALPVPVEVEAIVAAVAIEPEQLQVTRTEFTQWVREAAFHLAKERQFKNGSPSKDWFDAETYLTQQCAARGVAIVD